MGDCRIGLALNSFWMNTVHPSVSYAQLANVGDQTFPGAILTQWRPWMQTSLDSSQLRLHVMHAAFMLSCLAQVRCIQQILRLLNAVSRKRIHRTFPIWACMSISAKKWKNFLPILTMHLHCA